MTFKQSSSIEIRRNIIGFTILPHLTHLNLIITRQLSFQGFLVPNRKSYLAKAHPRKHSSNLFNLRGIEAMGFTNRLFLVFAVIAVGALIASQAILSRIPLDQYPFTGRGSTPISGKVIAGSQDSVIPLEYLGGVWVAQVELNDFHEAKLIVDTGATFTTLSEDLAFDAGIQSDNVSSRVTLFTAGGKVQAELGVARKIRVGNAGMNDVQVVIHTIPNLPDGIDGLLGLSFFDRFLVHLDHSNQQLHLSPRT